MQAKGCREWASGELGKCHSLSPELDRGHKTWYVNACHTPVAFCGWGHQHFGHGGQLQLLQGSYWVDGHYMVVW